MWQTARMAEATPPFDPADFERGFQAGRELTVADPDRLCVDCGYPMRGQPVRVEPMTRIALCRCPECGRYMPGDGALAASDLVVRRLAGPLLTLWLLVLFGLAVAAAIALWIGQVVAYENLPRNSAPGLGTLLALLLCAAGTVAAAGALPAALVLTVAAGRAVPMLLLAAVPLLAAVAATEAFALAVSRNQWNSARLELHPPVRLLLYVIALAGALGVIYLGRPLARLLLRVVLPAKLLPVFAHLWIRDGLAVPTPSPD